MIAIKREKVSRRVTAESHVAAPHAIFKDECEIGAFSYLGKGSVVQSTTIGRYCSIAPNVTIGPADHNMSLLSTHLFSSGSWGPFRNSPEYKEIRSKIKDPRKIARTFVGNDVWIGANVFVRRGVTIGDGAVIAAGATVVKDVEPYAVVGGVPARIIRYRFSDDIRDSLLDLKWWNYDLSKLSQPIDYSNINGAIDLLRAEITAGLPVLTPKITVIEKPDG